MLPGAARRIRVDNIAGVKVPVFKAVDTGAVSQDHTGLSNLGSAISFFRDTFEGSRALELPLERVGLSGYQVAHHITDMYHHRTFRGTYTKTLQPSGLGEIAAREAVGLSVAADEEEEDEEEDTCLLWSPTGSGACLQWASEQDAYTGRSRRFEKKSPT